ncbi:MAG: hypothetical protein RIM23_01985 [Coleofasciculus sp. G3-WIS-01]|uniref:hypothetical protein n=1 Tax=Coleofasciculus sp. G3-WIS-01 TaxID=3069528 RepID=UPI0032F83FF6
MTSQHKPYQNYQDALTQAQGELIEVLWQPDDNCYPWNPAEPEAQDYLADLEAGFSLDACQTAAEITSGSQTLFNRLHQCWTSLTPSDSSGSASVKRSLAQRFSGVPASWLDAIADQAQQALSMNQSFADKLVLCVKPLLPNWSEDDLLIFARPWAYSMRGNQEFGTVGSVKWSELSPIEQVRLSLAIAHYTLTQLDNDPEDN